MMGDNSNCSMKSAEFQSLPLAKLERSLDSQLDFSNQGIPDMLKKMQVESNQGCSFDKGIFNASNSTSRKRRHDFDPDRPPSKKTKTEETNFSDFLTSISTSTVPVDMGDPFLVHDESSIDGLPRQKLKEMKMQNIEKLEIKTTPFEKISPFDSPFSIKPKKSWAQVAGSQDEEEKKEEEKSVSVATTSDSGSSPRAAPTPFPWILNKAKENTPSLESTSDCSSDTKSSIKSIAEKPKEMSEGRKKYRLHQIKLGKESKGYKNYIRVVPRCQRKRYGKNRDIWTPEWTDNSLSKRRFDGLLLAWRKALHDYDDLDPDL